MFLRTRVEFESILRNYAPSTVAIEQSPESLVTDHPRQLHAVEFTESLGGGAWQSLTNFINGPVDARVTVWDAAAAPQRVYRVRVDAGKP